MIKILPVMSLSCLFEPMFKKNDMQNLITRTLIACFWNLPFATHKSPVTRLHIC